MCTVASSGGSAASGVTMLKPSASAPASRAEARPGTSKQGFTRPRIRKN
ncbi:MAG: hypothetical protein MUF65_14785 [Rubritepida sp.]|nr:hypothetical protein [Rubritepida sp.]